MTLKLLGAALTVLAPSWIGFQIAARYARRPAELRGFQNGLAVLVTEVEYGATPMPDALRSAARASGPVAGAVLADAADRLEGGGGITPGEALAAALEERRGATCLTPADQEILAALVPVLGASDRRDQVRHLRLALERLAAAEAEATDERRRYEKMYRYVGVLSGLALVLILI
ncbi:stage III sporulation protein SpoIIIAB [Symbiobacterium thermophilum]|uniref:Stage III sporulation protein AB n=2 Tax=Symbiobacterium thermophilum TaxID=2734 RepID=Q67N97_SYMTH|nr:stage III sporulation protein SpoIIIAB [Symbiobacterium thermophilum]BAD40846.1 stage III sporulation protein AB [Symbiobacterium thermophilum IAM 14863]